MSTSNTITKTDLTNILNEVLLSPNYGGIYKASWTASSSSANGTQLTADLIIPAGTYVINCISPVASVDFSLAIAGRYKEMNKSGDSFTIIYSCDEEVTFHVSSAQSASVTFSYIDRGSLTAIQISKQGVATNVADYIVEQGTSGNWIYRKWNSGIAESWRNYYGTHSTTSAALGGYYGTVNFTMPKDSSSNDLFLTEPSIFASGRMGTGISMVCARDASATSATVHYLTNQSGSSTVITRLYAIGRWK